MPLDQKDIEAIERIVYKCGDDIAVSISRSFERLEERIDATESRLYSRLADVEDKVSACEGNLTENVESLRDALRG